MDVREKLVELIAQKVCDTWSEACDEWIPHDCGKCYANDCHIADVADHLIAHGVTVQEWISVEDRLPEAGGYVVCIAKRNPFSRFMPMVARIKKNGWANPITEQYISEVTHWMPTAAAAERRMNMDKCRQACPYNTLDGCKVKEYGGVCPLTNIATSITEHRMTNADRIRSMTDDELNELFHEFIMQAQNMLLHMNGGNS